MQRKLSILFRRLITLSVNNNNNTQRKQLLTGLARVPAVAESDASKTSGRLSLHSRTARPRVATSHVIIRTT